MIPLTNYDFQWGRSEVAIISPVVWSSMDNLLVNIYGESIKIGRFLDSGEFILYKYVHWQLFFGTLPTDLESKHSLLLVAAGWGVFSLWLHNQTTKYGQSIDQTE